MIMRCLKTGVLGAVLGAACAAGCAGGPGSARMPADPVQRAAMRQSIRDTPLLERPDRPGHIYGNTVRRLHRRWSDGG